jgi:hypothetical protein
VLDAGMASMPLIWRASSRIILMSTMTYPHGECDDCHSRDATAK